MSGCGLLKQVLITMIKTSKIVKLSAASSSSGSRIALS